MIPFIEKYSSKESKINNPTEFFENKFSRSETKSLLRKIIHCVTDFDGIL